MFGTIIGDIVGSSYEFGKAPKQGFDLFLPKPDGDFTDDTVCTIAIADAILNHKSYKDSLIQWCSKYCNPKGGYGEAFYEWLLQGGKEPNNSSGNGAAMRVGAVGWLFDDYQMVIEEARKCTEVSHMHPEGIKGAQCVATLIYWLRTCRITKDEVEKTVKEKFGYDIPPLAEITKIGSEGHFDATCQETVPWAIRCFIDSNDFEETIRLAVLADGDTDTKAAIAGSIAEAYYEIPEDMIEKALSYLPAPMLSVIEQFYDEMQKHVKD